MEPYNGLPPFVAGSDTSEEAALAVMKKADADRARVYAFLLKAGATGMTDDELQVALNLEGSSERPRRIELTNKGMVQKTEQRRKTRTGSWAGVYVAVLPEERERAPEPEPPVAPHTLSMFDL